MLNYLFTKPSDSSYSQETIDILRLIRSENVGVKTFSNLIKLFGSASRALENIAEFSLKGGRSKPIKVFSQQEAEQEITALDKIGAKLITYKDPQYSSLLLQTFDYPPILAYKGNISLLNQDNIIAIVGARNASINGKHFAAKIANELLQAGYLTISGLARGIDAVVHNCNTSKTIAVIAGGIDNIYPPENAQLYEKISNEGLLLAEQPVNSKPLSSHFPMRNRIISGCAIGVAVIEASLKSGSLITANFATEQNREVFAVPGFPMDPRSAGANKLIKEGAYLLESVEDIVNNLARYKNIKNSLAEFSTNDNNFRTLALSSEIKITNKEREEIYNLLSATPVSYENISHETGLSLPIIYTVCLELELAGKIMRHPGNNISLIYNID